MAIAGAFVLVALIFVVIVILQIVVPGKDVDGNEVVIPTFTGLNYEEQITNLSLIHI